MLAVNERLLVAVNLKECDAKKGVNAEFKFFLAAQLENFLHSIFPFFVLLRHGWHIYALIEKYGMGVGGKEWAAGQWRHDFCLADAVAPLLRHGEFRVKELRMGRWKRKGAISARSWRRGTIC